MDILVILSMPRSGTSLATRVLGELGAQTPRDSVGSHPVLNPEGFFESASLMSIRTEVEDHVGVNFSVPAIWADVDWPTLVTSGRLDPWIDRAVEIIRSYESGGAPLAFKDPRTAATLPFWEEVFCRGRWLVRFVVAARRPAATAASIGRFNNLSVPMATLLWIETFSKIAIHLRETPFLLLTHERWSEGTAQLEALQLALFGSPLEPDRRDRITSTLRVTDPAPTPVGALGRFAEEMYAALDTLPLANASYPSSDITRLAELYLEHACVLGEVLSPDANRLLFDFDRREREWATRLAAAAA